MTKNSDRFLVFFNRIESALKGIRQNHEYITFYRLVEQASKSNPIVRRYKDDLFELADLRNAIVHERTDPNFAIAEPHDSTVDTIERIEKEILQPRKVIPQFARTVESFQLSDSLSTVLKVIDEKEFSQFPVYDNEEFTGIITANGITNWLAKNVTEEIVDLVDTSLRDVLEFDEHQSNYLFIDKDKTVLEAEELFKEPLGKGKRLEILLITHSGAPSQKMIGIITPWDIFNI